MIKYIKQNFQDNRMWHCYIILRILIKLNNFPQKIYKAISYGKREQTSPVTIEEIDHIAKVLFLPNPEWADFRLNFKAYKSLLSLVHWSSINKNNLSIHIYLSIHSLRPAWKRR